MATRKPGSLEESPAKFEGLGFEDEAGPGPNRMRDVRGILGKKQSEMADLVGVGLSTWQSYEGGSPPKTSVLSALCGLGFSGTWLLTGRGDPRGRKGVESALDLDLIGDIIEALEAGLAERSLELQPAKKAAAIGLLYQYFSEAGEVDSGQVGRVIALVA